MHPLYIHRGNPYQSGHGIGALFAAGAGLMPLITKYAPKVFKYIKKGVTKLFGLAKKSKPIAKALLKNKAIKKAAKAIKKSYIKSGANLAKEISIGAKNKQIDKLKKKLHQEHGIDFEENKKGHKRKRANSIFED